MTINSHGNQPNHLSWMTSQSHFKVITIKKISAHPSTSCESMNVQLKKRDASFRLVLSKHFAILLLKTPCFAIHLGAFEWLPFASAVLCCRLFMPLLNGRVDNDGEVRCLFFPFLDLQYTGSPLTRTLPPLSTVQFKFALWNSSWRGHFFISRH